MRFGLRLVAQLNEAFASPSTQSIGATNKRGLGEKNGLSRARAFQMAAMALGLTHVGANSICADIRLAGQYASTRHICSHCCMLGCLPCALNSTLVHLHASQTWALVATVTACLSCGKTHCDRQTTYAR